jgi:hypothetical protein
MARFVKNIQDSYHKFQINLQGKTLLTEAATGNYVCTPIIAAMAGAKVYAIAKESKYGTIAQIKNEVSSIAKCLKVEKKISIIKNLNEISLSGMDIVTNTGFVRPINKSLIDRLKPDCVIPLMWEPWEFRQEELDLDYAISKGIKVYGTNEADVRLQTMYYIGLTVLYFLLKEKRSPLSTKVLVIGCERFNNAIEVVLKKQGYPVKCLLTDFYNRIDINEYDTIVIAEHTNAKLIIGDNSEALIKNSDLGKDHLIIHIAGNVDFSSNQYHRYPEKPASFGYMSYTADFIDQLAVIDLHAAGLKVAEGMLRANNLGLNGLRYKSFMEKWYPALAFEDMTLW